MTNEIKRAVLNLIAAVENDVIEEVETISDEVEMALVDLEGKIRQDERQKILKDNWMRYGGE